MSYYKKLLTTNVVVSTTYILFFSLVLSVFSFFFEKKVYETNMTDYIQNIADDIDFSISNTVALSRTVSNSEYVQNYAKETEPDYINRSKVKLFLRNAVDILLRNDAELAVTKYYDNHVITSKYTSNFDYLYERYGFSADDIAGAIAELNSDPLPNTACIVSKNEKISYLTVVTKDSSILALPYYVLVFYPINILFDTGQYKDVLTPAISIGGKLVYIGDEELYDIASEYISSQNTNGRKIFTFTPNTVNTTQRLTYHFIVRNNYMSQFIPNILLPFLLCVPLFIIGLFLMLRVTKKIYEPVNKLVNALPNSENASENEFEFVMSEFYHLESSNNERDRTINQFKMSAKDKFISDLLFGTLSSREVIQYSKEYHLPPISHEVTVVIAEYNNYDNLVKTLSRGGLFRLKTTVTSLLHSVFGDKTLIITETSPDNHVIIAECGDISKLRVSFQTTLLQIMEDMDIEISASIGHPVDTYVDLCDSYYSAIEVSRHQSLDFEHKVVATFLDYENERENRIMYLPQAESNLIAAVSSCNFDVAHSLLQSIMRESHVSSKDGFAQLVIMLYSTIQKILYNLNVAEKEVFGEGTSVYLDMRSCQSISALKSTFTAQLNTLMNFISEMNISRIAERSDKMKLFIEQHYTEDISLLQLAEFMNMSQEHTSRIFKQETGTNFKEYLMRLRYEKAMEILDKDPGSKLQDVAAKVGCVNAKNLSRLIARYKNESTP